jgi:hypothetical protein
MSVARALVNGTWVDTTFSTAELKHSTAWKVDEPSGDYMASVAVNCPKNYEDAWTLPGKPFRIYDATGGLIWGGVTSEPDRSEGALTVHARGIGSVLKDWPSIYDADPGAGTDLQPSFVPNDVVDYAESQGAPFSRHGVDLGSSPITDGGLGTLTDIWSLLHRAATAQGKRVYVDSIGAITFRSDPTTPEWTTTPDEGYMGTTDDQFVTHLYGYYLKLSAITARVRLTGTPTGGSFTLSGNGATTGAIAWNASAATVQTAVQGLGGVYATAVVTIPFSAARTWDVKTTAGGGTLTGSGASLTGGASPAVWVETIDGDAIVVAYDETAAEKFSRRGKTIDMTDLGAMSTAAAQTFIDGRFALMGGRLGWTEGLNLLHVSGMWAPARYVRAGEMLQIPGITDARSNPTTRGSIRFVLSEVEVVERQRPTAFAAPVGFSPRDFEGALAPPEKPAEKEAA